MENSNITELTNYPNYAALNNSTLEETYSNSTAAELNLPYAACEILVAVSAVFGNGLVIIVFARERRLRRRTNYYIISLATADLLVGLFAIPFAILASIGLPTNLHACLFTVSVLVVLCTISIFCLVAVSIDRYWAILYPMGYSRTVRTRTAIGIICVCWIAGTLVGFLPLLGWNAGEKSDEKCLFTEVMDYNYLVFLYFATIIFPALLIAAFYAHIYRVVVKQLQRIMTMNPGRKSENQTTGTMLRLLGAAQKREVKATQNLSRIVMFFIVCWFPLYTINCVKAFCPDCEVSSFLLNLCIILSHLNSVGNPLLYAYHLKDFRAALKNFICRLLFPKSDVKSSVISVINDRTSIAYNHNVNKMDRFIDGSRRKNVNLAAMKGARVTIPQNNSPPVVFDEVAIFSPDSSPAHNPQEMDAFVTEDASREVSPDISDHRRDEKSSNDDRSNSGIFAIVTPPSPASPSEIGHPLELRAYRPFVRILNSDSLSTESVFVIEADVNHCVSSRERLTSGERPIGQPDR